MHIAKHFGAVLLKNGRNQTDVYSYSFFASRFVFWVALGFTLGLQVARYLNFKTSTTCSHPSGRKRPQAAASSGLLEDKPLHVAAMGCFAATRVAACGPKWLLGIGFATASPDIPFIKTGQRILFRESHFSPNSLATLRSSCGKC